MKILYGVVGEGMGHAMRSRVVLEHLVAAGHDVEIMASGRAAGFLGQRFDGVNRIHGLHMILEENRVRLGKTLWANVLSGARGLPGNIGAYFRLVDDFQPALVISDFESWTYLYGQTHRLPILSLDNMQAIHRCTVDDALRDGHEVAFQLTKAFIKSKLPMCDAYLVTSFADLPVRKPATTLVPPILRPEILAATASAGEHLLVYQSGPNPALEAALTRAGVPCRIYGMRPGATDEQVAGALRFRPFSETTFIADLASCRGVVAGGGFTLMGEAVFLHKPMLAIPLAGQFEQVFNARLLARAGYGAATEDPGEPGVVERFVAALPQYAAALAGYRQDGNRAVLSEVDRFIARHGGA